MTNPSSWLPPATGIAKSAYGLTHTPATRPGGPHQLCEPLALATLPSQVYLSSTSGTVLER